MVFFPNNFKCKYCNNFVCDFFRCEIHFANKLAAHQFCAKVFDRARFGIFSRNKALHFKVDGVLLSFCIHTFYFIIYSKYVLKNACVQLYRSEIFYRFLFEQI